METTLIKPSNWLKLWAGAMGLAFERVQPAAHNGHVFVARPTEIPPDDLTLIHGIGPTFAQRLQDAGITTYAQVAAMMPYELQTMTKAANWQANPEEWIEQAKEFLR